MAFARGRGLSGAGFFLVSVVATRSVDGQCVWAAGPGESAGPLRRPECCLALPRELEVPVGYNDRLVCF